MNREELEDQLEHWLNVDYRMDNEGFEYCFKHYSSFSEIKDEEFHNLRLSMLSQMENMRKLVSDKIEKAFIDGKNYIEGDGT
jgi:hypothetical protein